MHDLYPILQGFNAPSMQCSCSWLLSFPDLLLELLLAWHVGFVLIGNNNIPCSSPAAFISCRGVNIIVLCTSTVKMSRFYWAFQTQHTQLLKCIAIVLLEFKQWGMNLASLMISTRHKHTQANLHTRCFLCRSCSGGGHWPWSNFQVIMLMVK